jgi:hypothetical protein
MTKRQKDAFIAALNRVQEIQRMCLGTEAHFMVQVRTFDDGDLGIMVTIHKADSDVFLHPCLYSAAYSNNAAGRKKFFNEIITPLREWGVL